MKNRMIFLIAGSVFASGLFAAGAVEDQEKQKKKEPPVRGYEVVTVTAEASAIEVTKTPNPVVVLDAEKIEEAGSNTLTRILEIAFPGRTSPLGGCGTQTSLFMNGARSTDTVLILDGIKITDTNLGLNMSDFNLTGIDRLEVMPGPASTLYGSEAHGGVISLSSKGPSDKTGFSGHLLGELNSHGHIRIGAAASYAWDKGWVQGGGDTEESPQSIETNNPFRQASGHVGIGFQFADAWLFSANHRSSYVGAPTPFQLVTEYDDSWTPISTSRYLDKGSEFLMWQSITTASFKGHFVDSVYGEFNLGCVSQENVSNVGSDMGTDVTGSKIERLQGNAKATWKNEKARVTGLVDYSSDTLKGFLDWPYRVDGDTSKGTHTAFAIEGSIEPIPELRFVVSGRQQSDNMDPMEEESISENQFTWKVGANLLMPSGFRAYVSTGTSFNVPSLYQLNTNKNAGISKPGNESSSSILVGIGYEHNKRWWVRVDANRIKYSELLNYVSDYTLPTYGYYENIYDIRVQGLELAGGARGENWDAELWARSQEGRKMDEPKERQLITAFQRQPFFSAGMRANYVAGKLFCGMNLSYIGHRYDYPLDGGPAANKTHYIDCSLRAGMNISESLTVSLRAERLFQDGIGQEDWENCKDIGRNNIGYAQGFPSHGRSIGLEVKYKF